MMYYCPCPCIEPLDSCSAGEEEDDDEEDKTFLSLPRNLSYVQESYLDAHSVSGRFVHNPRTDRQILHNNKKLNDHFSNPFGYSNYSSDEKDTHFRHNGNHEVTNSKWRADGTKVEVESTNGLMVEHGLTSESTNYCKVGDVLNEGIESHQGNEYHYRSVSGETNLGTNSFPRTNGKLGSDNTPVSLCCSQPQLYDSNSYTNANPSVLDSNSNSTSNSDAVIVTPSSSTTLTTDPAIASKAIVSTSPLLTTNPKSPSQRSKLTNITSLSPSRQSFLSKVSSLLSPPSKDAETAAVNNQYMPQSDDLFNHQYLGSSVDDESIFTADAVKNISPSDDITTNSPNLLKSPDRSGLVMDRGEDLLVSNHERLQFDISAPANSSENTSASYFEDSANSKVVHDEMFVLEYDEVNISMSYQQLPVTTSPSITSCDQPDLKNTSSVTTIATAEQFSQMTSDTDDTWTDEAVTATATASVEVANCRESADSDASSEEGVFVNTLDDSDIFVNSEKSVSEVSDDTNVSVDSLYGSPGTEKETCIGISELTAENDVVVNEVRGNEDQRRMSLEEAISRAASDFNRMSAILYPKVLGSKLKDLLPSESPSTSKGYEKRGFGNLYVDISADSTEVKGQDDNSPRESPVYEDKEFNFSRKNLRKSSSLKTNKTPPGTPHRKKAVRFADAMGLDLESVRHVLNLESPPKIPLSAMADLKSGLSDDRVGIGTRYLTANFTQPGAINNFVQSVVLQKVRLENAINTDLTITGFIRVANISFHKSVRVRYTHNNWSTFHDIAANYIQNSCDGPTDRFAFSIVAPAHFVPGDRLEFAVSYNVDGTEYWDNNGGLNYGFECFAKSVPTDNDSEWMHFL